MKRECKYCENQFNSEKDGYGLYPTTCEICKAKGMSIFFGLFTVLIMSSAIFSQMIEYFIILGVGIIIVAEWRYLKYKRKPNGFFQTIGWKFWEIIQAFILWWAPAGMIVLIYKNLNYILNGIWWNIINLPPAFLNAIIQLGNGILSVGSILLIIIIIVVLFIAWAYLNAWLVRRG